ncbi:hypothetical protein N9W17_05620, partial [Jannaschia sp.]|nr:hypothetical protein [Jannaschia sp.]
LGFDGNAVGAKRDDRQIRASADHHALETGQLGQDGPAAGQEQADGQQEKHNEAHRGNPIAGLQAGPERGRRRSIVPSASEKRIA